MKASQAKQKEDEDKGDHEFTEEEKEQMAEDLWYILNEKLEGTEAKGNLKGLTDGDGIMAWQKVYKWYSAVTGATLSVKMSQAMNPEQPKKVTETAAKLEEWSAVVESREKYGKDIHYRFPSRLRH
eukprot:9481258-Pyramimonas_sp.AAC.4